MEISPLILPVGGAVPLLVEWFKNSPLFPEITSETKEKLIAVSALLTAAGSLMAGIADGSLTFDGLQTIWGALMHFIATFGIAEATYRHLLREAPVSETTTE